MWVRTVGNLYSYTKRQDAARKLARVERDIASNIPPLPGIFPDSMAPTVISAPSDGKRELMMIRWGSRMTASEPKRTFPVGLALQIAT